MEETRVLHLARIAAAAAAGRRTALRDFYREARAASVPVADLQEATLQVFLFAGYPRAIAAFGELHEALPGAPPAPVEPAADFEGRGAEVFGAVYGPHAAEVRRKLEALHPDLARFILADAYGQVLGRPFLGIEEREILAVAMLAALDQERELRAHVKGALRVGVPAAFVRAAVDAAEVGVGRALPDARRVVERALNG